MLLSCQVLGQRLETRWHINSISQAVQSGIGMSSKHRSCKAYLNKFSIQCDGARLLTHALELVDSGEFI